MKLTHIIFALIPISALFAGNWEILRRADWEFPLCRVLFIDEQIGYVAGRHDQLLLTTDGGKNWSRVDWPDSLIGTVIDGLWGDMTCCANGDLLLCGSGSYFLRISPPARSFRFFELQGDPALSGAFSIVGDKLWACGYRGALYFSENGGKEWRQLADLTTAESILWDIHFLNDSDGFLLRRIGRDQNECLRTRDGGRTWTTILSQPTLGKRLFFVDNRHGWILGTRHDIFCTQNGGENWQRIQVTDDSCRLRALFFLNDRIGYLAGEDGLFFKTVDGGRSWVAAAAPSFNPVNDLYFLTETKGGAAADAGVIACTEDGGNSWQWQMRAPSNSLYGVHFMDRRTGCAVGEHLFIRTENGGAAWTQTDTIDGQQIQFVDPSAGWISGLQHILRTTDGGKSWEMSAFFVDDTLTCIRFLTREIGWALSGRFRQSKLFRTQDGGKSWELMQTLPYYLTAMDFVTPQKGWLIGAAGRILRTEDGGASWRLLRETEDTYFNHLHALDFVDDRFGWVIALNATILATQDGGETWTVQFQPSLSEDVLQDIQFFDRREGYAVTSAGLVLHTQDSGTTWKWENTVPLDCSWSDVHFVDPACAWAVGTGGRVGRYFDPALDPTRVSERETQKAAGLFGEPLQVRNPVRGAATLIYSLPLPEAVHLEIYDLLGRRVRALESGVKGAGTYSVLWNLEDDLAHRVPAGTYICCLRLDGRPFIKKLTVIK